MRLFRRGQNILSNNDKLPAGCFSVDRTGIILASTLPISFPEQQLDAIAEVVLSVFRRGSQSGSPLSELSLHFDALIIKALELRGGAIVFLTPREDLLS